MIPPFSNVFILVVCFAPVVLADDFKTVEGKEYKNVTVSRVEPDGLVLSSKSGISKVYFTELPKEIQERFHYDAAKGNTYSAEQTANQEALYKRRQESERQRVEERDIGANIQCLRRHRMAIRLTYQVINPLNSRKILSPSRVPRTATWRVRVADNPAQQSVKTIRLFLDRSENEHHRGN